MVFRSKTQFRWKFIISKGAPQHHHPALIFISEKGDFETLAYNKIFNEVAAIATFLRQRQVKPGDRVSLALCLIRLKLLSLC